MKKFAILVFLTSLAVGAAACSKKKANTTPANDTTTAPDGMGGDAYGGDAEGTTPAADSENPCGGSEANPCGGD